MPLDPGVEAILKEMAASGAPPLHELDVEAARAFYLATVPPAPDVELTEVVDMDCPGPAGNIPLRCYRPSEARDLAAVMFFHGGGWVIGDLETHDALCRQLAARAGAVVIAVDYRLAPEHPYPAAPMDCYEASCWVYRNAETLGIDTGKIFLAGDSAGGNLAAVLAQMIRKEGPFIVRSQVLIYPVLDCDFETDSYNENAEGYLLSRDSMRWFWDHYAGEVSRTEPYASPLREPTLGLLPPTLIMTAEYDPLRDEGEAYAKRLEEASVTTELVRYDGMIHGFLHMNALIPKGDEALHHCAEWIRKYS